MTSEEILQKLFDHIRRQTEVKYALHRFVLPQTDCPTANAYDFRLSVAPSQRAVISALQYIGFRNTSKINTGAFINNSIDMIEYNFRKNTPGGSIVSRPDMKKYLVSFRSYDRVRRGIITKWKLLPTKNRL